jgi:hypothetical protein
MANRIGTFPTFANLAPPWSLPILDTSFVSVNTAFNDSSLGFVNATATDTGTANNYVVTLPYGAPSAYNQGMTVAFVPLNSNTGSSNITVSPLGSVSILSAAGGTLPANAIVAGVMVTLVYIGTAFRPLAGSPSNPLMSDQGSVAFGTFTINCGGFTSVAVNSVQTTAGTYIYNLTNLVIPTRVSFVISTNGASRLVKVNATDPTSVSYRTGVFYQSTAIFFGSATDGSTNWLIYSGVAMADSATGVPTLYFQGSFS